jgi:hypothetical protein
MSVGPIRPEVVEGMRHWRFVLEPNAWGVELDLHFRDTTRQVLRDPIVSPSRDLPGRQPHITAGFESFGTVEGWAEVGGQRVDLEPSTAVGSRDRHWGTGRGVGGPALAIGASALKGGHSGNAFVALRDLGIWGDRVFYYLGDPRKGAGNVVRVDRRVRFEPDTKIFIEAIIDYELSDGSSRQLHFGRLGFQTAYLRSGMYGGTPDGRHHQGVYPGQDLVEGEVHDVSDPANRMYLRGLDEHQCRVTDGDDEVVGIFQPIDPDAYEACAAGRRGWVFL